jgi:ABC-type antimicrobial peptide transport system permease subunit
MGIRLALGATRRQVIGLAMRQGARLAAIGIGLGLVASLFAARTIEDWLFETQGTDPTIIVLTVVVLGGSAALASFIPARRAASVDPAVALRDQ